MSRRRPDSPLPCSKVMSAEDYHQLSAELQTLDRYPDVLLGQHPVRRWEYAMAHYAMRQWAEWYWAEHPTATDRDSPREILDVGGAGSNFWQTLLSVTSERIIIIDPAAPHNHVQATPTGRYTIHACPVEEYAATARHDRFDIVTCISVIEHVEEVRPFARAIKMLLKPGGLLFLTTDFWDAEGEDTAHFHWMRKRIYNAHRMVRLLGDLRELGFRSFGESDWSYHGHQVYDYSVASAAMVKK